MKIIVLGAGLVGGPMAADLSKDDGFEVTIVDCNQKRLDEISRLYPTLNIMQKDLSAPGTLESVISNFDLVLNALPGFMGFSVLSRVVKAGKNIVDISFFPEDPFDLDELARNNGITAVVDCGVAPGLSNMLVGYATRQLDETREVKIYVGGLPEVRSWPYEYQAGFSPIDVIAEYTRPAKLVDNGRMVVRPALSEPELLDFSEIGTLEAFNTDGLRTLIRTIKALDMKEKTLRYPGHREKMAVLRESGFFSNEEHEIQGRRIRPLELTAQLLFPLWQMKEGDRDLTVMRVEVKGHKNGMARCFRYDLLDRYDAMTGIHSMARTTGYTAAAVVRLLADGAYRQVGITPPEFLGRFEGGLDFVRRCLEERGIRYHECIESPGGRKD